MQLSFKHALVACLVWCAVVSACYVYVVPSDLSAWAQARVSLLKEGPFSMMLAAVISAPSTVISSVYPTNWFPGYVSSSGQYLQDFSYAGYHMGAAIPTVSSGLTYDVTQSPYSADNTGAIDATAAIQKALDDAGHAGGGVVYLPAGTYKIHIIGGRYGLWLKYNNVVLRGAGSDKTFIYNDTYVMHGASVIRIMSAISGLSMENVVGASTLVAKDLPYPTKQIPVQSAVGFKVGDWVTLKFDTTDAFMADISMTGIWKAGDIAPMEFLRQVTAVDEANNIITIDIPTRYAVKMRDNARIYVTATPPHEIGLENFSIGNREHPGTWDWGNYGVESPPEGTPGYEVSQSHLIVFSYVVNSWARNVNTYKPSVNTHNYHAVSGILLLSSGARSITIQNVKIRNPQLLAGAEGYGFAIHGQENLIRDSSATNTRHNFAFWSPAASGNVLTNVTLTGSKKNSEYHGKFSLSNLIDDVTLNSERLNAIYYPSGNTPPHGITTSQSVFWNITGSGSVTSNQFGQGFIIGTASGVSASAPVNTSKPDLRPKDLLEAIGKASSLAPQSLYQDQLAKRLSGSTQPTCNITASATSTPPGGKVTLTWSSKNSRACSSIGFGSASASYGASGSIVVTPTNSSTYGVACSNFAETVMCNVAVAVDATIPNPDPKLSCSLKASPSTVTEGNDATLAWSSTNATSCNGSGFSTGTDHPSSGSVVVTPAATKTYGVNCKNATQSVLCEAKVTVNPVVTSNCIFTAKPSTVASGGKVTLTWKTSAAGGCGGKGFSTSSTGYAASGSVVVKPTSSHTYGVNCKDDKGALTISCSAPVTVK